MEVGLNASEFQPLFNATIMSNSDNVTFSGESGSFRQLTILLVFYYIPIISAIGLVGNILSFLVYLRTQLCKCSCNIYLAAVCLANTGVLIKLALQWIRVVSLSSNDISGSCQLVWFIDQSCAFLSFWYIVAFAVDRYIRLCRPARKAVFCTVMRARIVVMFLAVIAIVFYINLSLTQGMVRRGRRLKCASVRRFQPFQSTLAMMQVIVNVVLPNLLLLVMVVLIAVNTMCHRPAESSTPPVVNKEPSRTFVLVFLTTCLLLRVPSAVLPVLQMARHTMNMKTMTVHFLTLMRYLVETSFTVQVVVYFCAYAHFTQAVKRAFTRHFKRHHGYTLGNRHSSHECMDTVVNSSLSENCLTEV